MTLGARVLAGRYRLGGLLGQGGMAVVHGAEDAELGRTVAIKVLREPLSADPEFVERFRREARAAAALSHPNIVAVFDVGRDGDTSYIVMELVEGEDLKDLIRREAPLSPARVVNLGCQLAAALEYAHRRGIVHRDVKSQNVIVTPDGQLKIGDFGIAVALGSRSITQTGMVIGSVHYMAPEQLQGKPSTAATDVYSLGVVLYEMATGSLPFEADAPLAVARLHIEAEPASPQQLNPRLPPDLAAVISRAIEKDPSDRFQSAAEVAAALRGQRAQAGQRTAVVAAAPATATVRTRRVATEPTTPWTVVAEPPPRRAPPPGRPRQAGGGFGLGSFLLLGLLLGALGTAIGWFLASPPDAPVPQATPAPVVTQSPQPKPAEATKPAAPTTAPTPRPPTQTTVPTPPPPTAPPKPTIAPTRPPTRVEMPGVVGRSQADATRQLQQAGFRVEVKEERRPDAPDGVVTSQDPRPGTQVEQGRGVTITVGRLQRSPPPKAKANTVPNVEGMDEKEARKALQEAGYKVDVEEDGAPDRKGQVIDQRPGAGDTAPPGTTVKIIIGV